MATVFTPISLFSIVFFILVLSALLSFIDAQKGGFSVELIHRDSPKSPFYDALETTSDRVTNSLSRSLNRAHRFRLSSVSTINAPEADVIPSEGEYLMEISIGTPPFHITAIADTGSDLIWTQCQPCSQCFEQNAPLFNPSNSSTYKPISCSASQCSEQVTGSCSSGDNTCHYNINYHDTSFSSGDLATDTLTLPSLGRPMVFWKRTIGCARNSSGKFEKETSGIIGLGSGGLSLISQLRSSIDGKFSYCLSPGSSQGDSSKMNFGSNAIVSGDGVVSTPLLTKKSGDTFYRLNLEAVSVGSNRIKFTTSPVDGNIIIDSGTTYTLVPKDFYEELESAVSSQINARRVNGQNDLGLCYEAQSEFAVPDITVHFTGADVKLQPVNTFRKVNKTVCFTFISDDDVAIYGNLAQMNFLVGYDTQKQTVSFKPTDCSMN